MPFLVQRIISGGQTGVDRSALDVSMELGIPCGGWCPQGRLAEDGRIPERYPLTEAPTAVYAERTNLNVRDSDATLILTVGAPTGGTALTVQCARQLKKPWFTVDLNAAPDIAAVRRWLVAHVVETLNVAGPRASQQPGIGPRAAGFLRELLSLEPRL